MNNRNSACTISPSLSTAEPCVSRRLLSAGNPCAGRSVEALLTRIVHLRQPTWAEEHPSIMHRKGVRSRRNSDIKNGVSVDALRLNKCLRPVFLAVAVLLAMSIPTGCGVAPPNRTGLLAPTPASQLRPCGAAGRSCWQVEDITQATEIPPDAGALTAR